MRRDVAPRIGLLAAFLLLGGSALLGSCAAPSEHRAARALATDAAERCDLSLELRWTGMRGERGELSLENGQLRARLAARRLGPHPIYERVYISALSPRAQRALGRRLERSGLFSLHERIEDGAGRARSLRLRVTRHGRTLTLRSRASRCPELDLVLDALDSHCDVPIFASIPRAPDRRGRRSWSAKPEYAFDVHRRWLEDRPQDAELAFDLWLLAAAALRDEGKMRLVESLADSEELRRLRSTLRGRAAAPLR